jgi:hypothetical protein
MAGTLPLHERCEPGSAASADVVKRAAHRRGRRGGLRRHPLGQLAQLGEHPLHTAPRGRVTGIKIPGVLAADLDQPALTPSAGCSQGGGLATAAVTASTTLGERRTLLSRNAGPPDSNAGDVSMYPARHAIQPMSRLNRCSEISKTPTGVTHHLGGERCVCCRFWNTRCRWQRVRKRFL